MTLLQLLELLNQARDHVPSLHLRTSVEDFEVSTMDTPDHGFETAIRYNDGSWYPVARYKQKAEAKTGHNEWINKIPNLTEITMLGSELYGAKDTKFKISEL